MTTWTLLDYGVGNLHSLAKALTAAGAKVAITDDASALRDAKVAVLPGVGAFGAVMRRLAPAAPALRARHAAGRPILGICIGAQVMYVGSEESPGVAGLGFFPATVQRLPASAGKVPHMGWNTLDFAPSGAESSIAGPASQAARPVGREPLFEGVPAGSYVYYVHGYAAPVGPETTATTQYGTVFTAALRQGATLGVQFHPEKSSAVGQAILRNAVRTLEALA